MATQTPVAAMDKVLASAMQGIAPKLGMNVYDSFGLFNMIEKKGNKKPWSGEAIRQPIVTEKYGAAINYTDYDSFAIVAQEPFTVADFELAGAGRTVCVSNMQYRKLKTAPKKLIEYVEVETKMAIMAIKELLISNLTSTTNTSKGVLSLYTLTDATTTIGGVSGGSSWGGTTTASGSFASQGLTDLLTIKMTLSQYADLGGKDAAGTDIILTTPTVYRYMITALQPDQRYTGQTADPVLKASFDGVKVENDVSVNSGCIYLLNTNHLNLYVMSDADFTVQADVRPSNQDAFSRLIVWNGQITTDARRYHGKLTGVTA